MEKLELVLDPELGVSILALGLIYDVHVTKTRRTLDDRKRQGDRLRGLSASRRRTAQQGPAERFHRVRRGVRFLESQVEFILGWLRSTKVGQRCRAVFATNPPSSVEGEWIVRWFAPWVDPQHPLYPYPMGKLLWTCRGLEDEWLWFEAPGEQTVNGEVKHTISRTFIRSGLGDNPDLARTNYRTQLQMLPEELRKRYERGDFTAGASDDEFQVIPTEWIRRAQER